MNYHCKSWIFAASGDATCKKQFSPQASSLLPLTRMQSWRQHVDKAKNKTDGTSIGLALVLSISVLSLHASFLQFWSAEMNANWQGLFINAFQMADKTSCTHTVFMTKFRTAQVKCALVGPYLREACGTPYCGFSFSAFGMIKVLERDLLTAHQQTWPCAVSSKL